ncbi:hypothetical protein [uncultured Erythrobacter sp.]|uniref:hypothetical protein n=1 Tax=uncultured Erythrobacter sp. TaxID=263913 RepID=UPI00262D3469|nr:hypothetical protein [uncultured Erythrobacter sp.]
MSRDSKTKKPATGTQSPVQNLTYGLFGRKVASPAEPTKKGKNTTPNFGFAA